MTVPAAFTSTYPAIPQASLVLAIARVAPPAAPDELASLAARVQDWPRFEALVEEAALAPRVDRALATLPAGAVPADVIARIRGAATIASIRNLELARELGRAVALLERASIPTLALKGPALVRLAYGDLGRRQIADLDLLVHERDRAAARDVLARAGYRELHESPAAAPAVLDEYHDVLVSPSGTAMLELHWALSRGRFGFRYDEAWWWRECVRVDLPGAEICTFAPPTLLLYLTIHGAKHLWSQLKWLCDVAEVVRARPDLDWDAIERDARHVRAWRMLAVGLVLAHALLGAPVPEPVLARARRSRVVRALVRELSTKMRAGEPITIDLRALRWYLRLHDRARDRVRLALSLLTTPTAEDLDALTIPTRFRVLHRVARPFRLLAKYTRRRAAPMGR